MGLRIKLSVPLSPRDGYGNDGIGMSQAFLRRGIDLYLDPAYVSTPLPKDVAELLTKDDNPPYDAHIKHVNPVALKLTDAEKAQSYRHFAWSMWEWSSFGEEKAPLVADAANDYTKILAYDDVSVEAFRSTGTKTPVVMMQGGYDPSHWEGTKLRPLVRRDWNSDPFVFVMAGSITPRKDPYVALRALSKLHEEGYNIKFIIKTLYPGSVGHFLKESYPFLEIYEGPWSVEKMRDLYEHAHCYLGPSWGEGKNLPAIEAGTTGCALILSDVGGHRGWTMPTFATLVGGKQSSYDGTASLRVDEDLLADACRELVDDREKARKMGEQASLILPASMTWDKVVDKFLMEHMTG